VTPEVIEQLDRLDSVFGNLMVRLLHFFADTYKSVFKFEYPPLHDPLTVKLFLPNPLHPPRDTDRFSLFRLPMSCE